MTELWPQFTHERSLETGLHSTSHAEADDLAFLDYGNIMQGQIADMDDSRSFVSLDVSTSSNSSEEGAQESRWNFKQLDLEVKALKETYV